MMRGCILALLVFCQFVASDKEVQLQDEVLDISSNNVTLLKKSEAPNENDIQEEVKAELDRAVESLKESAKTKHEGTINTVVETLEPCGPVDCNNRGTCLGTKKTYLCACQLGYSGANCEETVCDSSRDCNGRGICLGTTNQLTCLCNLGYTGRRCETPI